MVGHFLGNFLSFFGPTRGAEAKRKLIVAAIFLLFFMGGTVISFPTFSFCSRHIPVFLCGSVSHLRIQKRKSCERERDMRFPFLYSQMGFPFAEVKRRITSNPSAPGLPFYLPHRGPFTLFFNLWPHIFSIVFS